MNFVQELLNKTGKDKILILLLAGIIMLVIAIPSQDSSDSAALSTEYEGSIDESAIEAKLKRCLSKVEGVGDVDVIVTYESDGKTAAGVIIVARGGDNGTVAAKVTNAVEALLGLPAHKIKVLKMLEGDS